MITVHRIAKRRHAEAALRGEGARLHGSRWSHPGLPALFFAEHLSLAMLEVLVHLGDTGPLGHYVRFTVNLGARDIATPNDLPADWWEQPSTDATRQVGSAFLAKGSRLVLRLPSAVVPGEHNYLIDPAHPRFARLEFSGPIALDFDPRLSGTRNSE